MEQLLQALPSTTVPNYLCEQVLGAVARERAAFERVRLYVSSLITTASAVGSVFAVSAFIHAAGASGFTAFISLLGSDSTLIAGHFNTFLLTLLESLPAVETILMLFVLAVFLASLKGLAGNFPRLRLPHFLSRFTLT